MADANFELPRLAAIYDALDPDRSDLEVYSAIADEFGARRVLDVGCGAGYAVHEVRGAPDRPGQEFVFLAGRPE